MVKLKPIAFDIYFCYECDKCGCKYNESQDYVNKIGKILCGCGRVLHLERIDAVKVELNQQPFHPIHPAIASLPAAGDKSFRAHCLALDTLKGLGYNHKTAVQKISACDSGWDFESSTEEDFVKYVLTKI